MQPQQGNSDLPPGMTGYVPLPPQRPEPERPQPQPANAFSIASLVFGILAAASLCLIYFTPFFAALSILFAVLSRGFHRKLHGLALAGILTSVTALMIEVCLVGSGVAMIVQTMQHPERLGSDFWRAYKESGEAVYGDQFDDMLREIYGEDFHIEDYIEGGILWF